MPVIARHRGSHAIRKRLAGLPNWWKNLPAYMVEAPIPTIAVKLLPERGEELREKFNAFSPAYHLNKKHWNDIFIEDTFPPEMIQGWIRESYDLVMSKLPKSTLEHLAP